MTKFVHTADWQLGMTRHFLSTEAQARFDQARIDAVTSIGRLAVEHGCGFAVVCGDVFETNQVTRKIVVRALEAMAATPNVTFYLLPGNHDPLDAASVFRSRTFVEHRPNNVVVLTDEQPLEVEAGVELIAAPWTSKRSVVDLVGRAVHSGLEANRAPLGVRIVVGHGAVDAMTPDSNSPALIGLAELEAAISSGDIHYVALGDRHSTTDVGTTGRIWYSGAPEPTDYDETDPANALVVDVDRDTVSVIAHKIGCWRFVRREIDVASSDDCGRLDRWLGELADKERTIVKLAIVGQVSLAVAMMLDEILEHHRDLLAALERSALRGELVVLPDGDDFESLELHGFAACALTDLRDAARDRDVEASDALALLYRLAMVTT